MTAALDLIGWLDRCRNPNGTVRERYKLSTRAWGTAIRPDCNTEAMLAWLRAWQATGDAAHLAKSRATWTAIKAMQNVDGSWPFADWIGTKWINDNSEVAIFLMRAADLDTVNAAEYRTAALATVNYLLSVQRADGAWQNGYSGTYAPMWAGHAVAALCTAYPHAGASVQAAIVTAVERGIAWMGTMTRATDDRVTTTYEVHGAEEAWRAPSSEQSISVRGVALAERTFPANANVAAWRTLRHRMHEWLDPLVDATTGAIRNGYGVGVTHADVAHITDHVYTTAFAIEAYRLSAALDHNPAYRVVADGIANFAAGNLYYSETDSNANGCLRGAYDLVAQDFNTSEVSQNAGEEGGGDMAYSGWSAAPVAALLFEAPPTINARRRRGSAAAFL